MNNKRINVVAAGVFLLVGALNTSAAEAETVTATKQTRVMQRPGEASAVVTRVDSGETLDVIAKRGRWYKVRVNGRTGWVTRTTVSSKRQARTPASNTRRRAFVDGRSTRRGWTGGVAPEDRIGADAVEVEEEMIAEEDTKKKKATKASKRKRTAKADRKKKTPRAKGAKRTAQRDDDFEDFEDEGFEDEEAEPEKEPAPKIVMVTASASKLHSKPSSRSRSVLSVENGQELFLIRESKSGKWLMVEDASGEAGWIRADDVGSSEFEYGKSMKRVGARLGYNALASNFASDGNGELANYQLSTGALSVNVGGDYIYKYSPKYLIMVDAGYLGTRASPGIRVTNAAGEVRDIGFLQHEVSAGAALGYNFRKKNGMAAYARAGYYYGKVAINDGANFDNNIAYLPSEILSGPTVGARFEIPRFNEKIGFLAGGDYLLSGKRQQTVGLEDGAASTVSAWWAGARLIYQWKPEYTINAGYRYAYSKTEWTGAVAESMRTTVTGPVTAAARKDTGHALTVGIGKAF